MTNKQVKMLLLNIVSRLEAAIDADSIVLDPLNEIVADVKAKAISLGDGSIDFSKPVRYLSGWLVEYRCAGCSCVVSDNERMYSNGRCPDCGHKGKGAATIMAVNEHAYRLVTQGKWWQFWIRPARSYRGSK